MAKLLGHSLQPQITRSTFFFYMRYYNSVGAEKDEEEGEREVERCYGGVLLGRGVSVVC